MAKAATKLRVLIVDDDQDAANSLATLVKLWGHAAWTAYSADSALALAKECEPHLAILDIGMPKMGGLTLAETLHQDPALERCELIALSGHTGQSVQERAHRIGMTHYLTKPADPEQLEKLLTQRAKKTRSREAAVASA